MLNDLERLFEDKNIKKCPLTNIILLDNTVTFRLYNDCFRRPMLMAGYHVNLYIISIINQFKLNSPVNIYILDNLELLKKSNTKLNLNRRENRTTSK